MSAKKDTKHTPQAKDASLSGHTPTPWHFDNRWPNCIMGYEKADSRQWIDRVCEYRYLSEADAELIIRAVNAHDAMLLALKRAKELLGDNGMWIEHYIAKAEGRE